jgi:hypothetical protein
MLHQEAYFSILPMNGLIESIGSVLVFKRWFEKKQKPAAVKTPEIIGLRLGGAFELDELKLRLIEPSLVVEGVAKTQLIQAVGIVALDESSTVLRYYTDDDGFLQVLLTGGMTENHIDDVKLWYFYDTKAIADDSQWEYLLKEVISQPSVTLEEYHYQRVWEGANSQSPPVAMTEKTHVENGSISETDQFAMLYEREFEGGQFEYLMKVGEERVIDNRLDRCIVTSTGFDLRPADIEIIG